MPPASLLLIAGGGMLGTLIRYGLATAHSVQAGVWPWVTFWINIVGSAVLGALLEGLAATGPDDGWRRRVRLAVGTGLLGGFTTYSTFSVEIVTLARAGEPVVATAYALVSVGAGIAAAFGASQAVRALIRTLRRRREPGVGR